MIDAVRAGQLLERLRRVQARGGYTDDDTTALSYRELRELLETVILTTAKGGLAIHSWERQQVYRSIDRERQRQDAQWGNPPSDVQSPLQWLRILMEELGEVAKALNDATEYEVRKEAVQLAASVVWWLEGQVSDRPADTEGCNHADAECYGPVVMKYDGLLCEHHRAIARGETE